MRRLGRGDGSRKGAGGEGGRGGAGRGGEPDYNTALTKNGSKTKALHNLIFTTSE